jgi:hypothetical protein
LRVQATNSAGRFEVTTDGVGVVGHAGAALLRELADRLGLTAALGWGGPQGRHRRHPDAAVLRDLAVLLADGGDCLSDLAVLRDQPGLFGRVASTPTAWRVIERVARDADGLARLRAARAHARARAWAVGGDPDVELLVVDADATLVLSHSDAKQGAAGTYKGSFGFAPLLAYLDRGPAPGEPLAGILRPGNAAPGAASDLVELVDLALAQLPAAGHALPVLVRSDSAGASTRLAWHLRDRGVEFSLGMQADAHVREAIGAQPEAAWRPAVDADGQARDGAEVCELTGWVDLGNWPPGTVCCAAARTPTPARSCASPTLTATASRCSSPTSPTPTARSLSCGTASAPASRTASAPPRPRACATCRSTWCAATPSGSSWSWPPRTSPAGPRRCCWTAASPRPNPRRCATGWPASSATPAARSFACNALALGRRARQGVHPPTGPAAALLTPPATPRVCQPRRGSRRGAHQPPAASRGRPQQRQHHPAPAAAPSQHAATPPDSRPRHRHRALMKSRG